MSNSAEIIISKLGGVDEVARAAGVDVSRVYRWTYPKERGGTDGEVPRRHWQSLIMAAHMRGIELQHDDFFQIPRPTKPRGKK
jgi:hypothetical protein